MAPQRILVVDDEPGVRSALEGILRDEGFEVHTVESGEDALTWLGASTGDAAPDAVLLDVWLPGIDGLETLRRLRETSSDAEVVMISGHGTIETAVRATKLGAFDFVEKPLSLDRTLLVLRNALRQRQLERTNRALVAQLGRDHRLVGEGPAIEGLRERIAEAAASTAPALVVGERGSGREKVVRAIHLAGARAAHAFVEVACGAFDPEAAEAALFGRDGRGDRMALARAGTLFLDELDRLAPNVQARLASRLASAEWAELDVRVLATASGEGEGIAAELRPSVDVLRIAVAPLRERRADIRPAFEAAMAALAREYGRAAKALAPAAAEALERYPWPGNLRELEHVAERLLLSIPGDTIEDADVANLSAWAGGEGRVDLHAAFESLEAALAACERFHVSRALREARGDAVRAAKILGKSADWVRRRRS